MKNRSDFFPTALKYVSLRINIIESGKVTSEAAEDWLHGVHNPSDCNTTHIYICVNK